MTVLSKRKDVGGHHVVSEESLIRSTTTGAKRTSRGATTVVKGPFEAKIVFRHRCNNNKRNLVLGSFKVQNETMDEERGGSMINLTNDGESCKKIKMNLYKEAINIASLFDSFDQGTSKSFLHRRNYTSCSTIMTTPVLPPAVLVQEAETKSKLKRDTKKVALLPTFLPASKSLIAAGVGGCLSITATPTL